MGYDKHAGKNQTPSLVEIADGSKPTMLAEKQRLAPEETVKRKRTKLCKKQHLKIGTRAQNTLYNNISEALKSARNTNLKETVKRIQSYIIEDIN
jgi:hypothetical protein